MLHKVKIELPHMAGFRISSHNRPFKQYLYRPQRSWAKVMFLQASVILLTGGGVCLSACWDTTPWEQTSPWEQTPLGPNPPEQTSPPEQTPPPRSNPPWSRPPPGSRLRDTVNERPVRILLECILVRISVTVTFIPCPEHQHIVGSRS